MKVALFSDHTGGVYVYSQRLTKQLTQLGVHVDFITHPPRDDIGAARLFSLKEDRVTLRLVPRNKEEVSQEQTQQLYEAYLASEADVIIPNYRAISYAAVAQLSRERKSRILGICHDHSPVMYQFLKYYEPIIHGFICPASKTYERLQEILPHRRQDIRHIAHGVPGVEGTAPSYEGGEIRLVYHGRLEEEQKSVSSLIHLAERLAKNGIAFKLLLAGDGPDQQSYRDRVKANGLGDRIEFLGHLEGAALDQVLRESHVAVLTSRHEGFCLSLAEAMAAGLPGLAFDCGGVINDYLVNGDSGFILPWGDLDGMSERVREFSNQPSEWRRMSLNARRRMSESFGLQQFGERTKQFMAELLGREERREWPKSGKSVFYTESRLASLGRSLISRIRGSKAGDAR